MIAKIKSNKINTKESCVQMTNSINLNYFFVMQMNLMIEPKSCDAVTSTQTLKLFILIYLKCLKEKEIKTSKTKFKIL